MNISHFFKQRSFKYGSLATLITVLFIVAIFIVNFILYNVFNAYPLKLDLTTQQNYKISSQSIDFLKTINKDVVITIINDGTTFTEDFFEGNNNLETIPNGATTKNALKIALQSLKQYTTYNHKIKLTFLNVTKYPAFASQYPKETLNAGDIIVSAGSRYKKINAQELFVWSQDQTTGSSYISGSQTEQTIDTTLLIVTNNNTPIIAFTIGHSEKDSSEFQSLLKANNYDIKTQNLSTLDISSSISTIVIIAPKVDFLESEIQMLDKFIVNNGDYGKNVMVFFDASQTTLPNLEAFTKEWGIQAESGIVYDPNGIGTNLVPAAGTINTTYASNIPSGIPTYLPNAKQLTLLYTTRADRKTDNIIQTTDTSALWVPKSSSDQFKASSSDKKGPFTIMAIGSISNYDSNNIELKSNVLVSGSVQAINSSSILSNASYNNGTVMIDIVNSLIGVKSSINVLPISLKILGPELTSSQIGMINVILSAVIPLLIIIFGIIIWLRRRHR
jgi:ABC-2 type transport system permease protein